MQTYLIAALLSASVAFGAAWKVQDWRYGDQIAEIRIDQAEDKVKAAQSLVKAKTKAAEDQITAVNEARTEERRHVATINNALKEATKRAQIHRDNAAATRREYDSLRDNLDALKAGMPYLTERAVRERAATLSGLLGDCAAEYSGMAATAQRHASDVKTLTDAWPKPPN